MEPEGATLLQPPERRRLVQQPPAAGSRLTRGVTAGDPVWVCEDADAQGHALHVSVGDRAPGLLLAMRSDIEPVRSRRQPESLARTRPQHPRRGHAEETVQEEEGTANQSTFFCSLCIKLTGLLSFQVFDTAVSKI